MKNDEIIKILRNDKKRKKQMLKETVEKRIQKTSKEKFDIQEIYFYSQYFNISMSNFLLNILEVKLEDYIKFTKGYIRKINSEKYNKVKNNYIKKQKTRLKYRINWNKKTYYNKENLLEKAKEYQINVKDFSTKILEKSMSCTNRILKDETNKKRLFVGKYVNTALPNGYIETNIKEITNIARIATNKASKKLGMKLPIEEYNEEIQKCTIFISYHGNKLKKNNKPSIISEKYKNYHGKLFYHIGLYYEMGEIKKLKTENSYNDKIQYGKNDESSYNSVFDLIEQLKLNQIQKRIAQKRYAGYQKGEILEQERISEEEYIKNLKEIKKQIQLSNRVY